jgi:hypothetical protein
MKRIPLRRHIVELKKDPKSDGIMSEGGRADASNFPTLKVMKQWDKWKPFWTAMDTAQLVEMVLHPNYKPQAGEEKLYH